MIVVVNRESISGSQTILAFDFGERRIGVAIGEASIGISHPLTTVHASSKEQRYTLIGKLIREWQPQLLVVGLPMYMDGSEHKLSALARKFARDLQERFQIKVCLIDERLSSAAAADALTEVGVHKKKHKQLLDQVAAQEILNTFFAQNSHASS